MTLKKYTKVGLVAGDDVFIGPYVEITRPKLARVGHHSAIDAFFFCTTKLNVADYVHIAPSVSVIGGADSELELADFSFIATGSRIVCGSEDYTDDGLIGPTVPKQYKSKTIISKVTFERFSGVGANCVVFPGVTLAIGSVVGANSTVTKSTEPWTIYVGSPARPLKLRSHANILKYAAEMGYV